MLMSIASEAKLKMGRQSAFSLNPKFTRAQSAAIHLLWFASTGKFHEGKKSIGELL